MLSPDERLQAESELAPEELLLPDGTIPYKPVPNVIQAPVGSMRADARPMMLPDEADYESYGDSVQHPIGQRDSGEPVRMYGIPGSRPVSSFENKPAADTIGDFQASAAAEDASRLEDVGPLPDYNRDMAVADLAANPKEAAQYAAPFGDLPPLPDEQEMQKGVRMAARDEGPAPRPVQTARKWLDSTGRYATVGTLVKYDNGVAHIRKESGGVVQVPLARLSPEDQDFVDPTRGQVPQKPAPQAVAKGPAAAVPPKPAMEAGPEALKPGPGEEAQEGAPQAAQARAKPVPVRASPEMRERGIDAVWPGIQRYAEAHGYSKEMARKVYNDVSARGGSHAEGMAAIKGLIGNVRSEMKASFADEQRSRLIHEAEARRRGMAPADYELHKSIQNSPSMDPNQRINALIMLHHRYPNHGFGNLAALAIKGMNDAQAADQLAGNGPRLPAENADRNLQFIMGRGPSATTMTDLKGHYTQTAAGAKDPAGATRFAQNTAAPKFAEVYNKPGLTPDQAQFVRNYMTSFSSYDEFQSVTGIPDSPQLRAMWRDKTGRDDRTGGQQFLDWGMGLASSAMQGINSLMNPQPKPPANNVAGQGKK